MPRYSYTAIAPSGRRSRGTMAAANERDLHERLGELGLHLTRARDLGRRQRFLGAARGRPPVREVALFAQHMQVLLEAGVPAAEALVDLRDSADGAMRDLLAGMTRDVTEEDRLSEAMARRPAVFGSPAVAIIAAGEQTGALGAAFGRLSHHLSWHDRMRSQIRRALYYPLLVFVLLILAAAVLFGWTLPRVAEVLDQVGAEMPLVTRALLAVNELVLGHWPLLIGGPVLILLLPLALRAGSQQLGRRIDAAVLRLPGFGRMVREAALARFARIFSETLASGLPVIQCLDTAALVVRNRAMLALLERMRSEVESAGISLSEAMRRSGAFAPMVVRMVEVGEETGTLAQRLDEIANFYDTELDRRVQGLVAALGPALILVLGLLIGWVFLGVMWPVWSMASGA